MNTENKNNPTDASLWIISNTNLPFHVSYFAGFTFWRHRVKYKWLGKAKTFDSQEEAELFVLLYLPPVSGKGYSILPLTEKLLRLAQPEDETSE